MQDGRSRSDLLLLNVFNQTREDVTAQLLDFLASRRVIAAIPNISISNIRDAIVSSLANRDAVCSKGTGSDAAYGNLEDWCDCSSVRNSKQCAASDDGSIGGCWGFCCS